MNGIFSSRIFRDPVIGVKSSRDLVFESNDSSISVARASVAILINSGWAGLIRFGNIL